MQLEYEIVIAIAVVLALFIYLTIRRYRVYLYAWKFGLPKPKYRVRVDRDVKIPMLDGILLFADVYRPRVRGKFPVIIARTPYDKSGTLYSYKEVAETFASQGYVVVIQDVRGKNASEGKFLPYFHEALDGHSTINWAAQASWSNGLVAMVGTSYLGSCAWLATQYENPHLRTLIPMFTTYDTYTIWMDHGLPYLKGPLLWLSEFSERRTDPKFRYQKVEHSLWKLPVSELDIAAAGHPMPFYREYLTHRVPDHFWERIGPQKEENLDIPALIIGGWYDPFVKGTIEDFQRMQRSPHTKSQQSELLIGPWAHNPAEKFKGIDFGKEAGLHFILKACLSWYNRWLKQTERPSSQFKVRYFLMGKNQWKTAQQWPPEQGKEQIFYLSGSEGSLKQNLPLESHLQHYRYSPRDPALFRGSHLLYTDGWIMPLEQEDMTERHDVLVYTSDPLEEELAAVGEIKLVLHVSSTALDTDFCVKLSDVHPNGKAYNVTPGFFRMRYRDSLAHPKLMEPGTVYRVEIVLRPTAHAFLKRHRLQLQIASSDFPIHNRNLNTGMSCEYTTEMREAEQTVYTGGVYDSHLLLPCL